jgi:hypothetical protein
MVEDRILEALENIKVEMAKVTALIEERNNTAVAWRLEVCEKFNRIFKWLSVLPCKERQERSNSQKIFDGLLWGAIGITFTLLIVHLGWYSK